MPPTTAVDAVADAVVEGKDDEEETTTDNDGRLISLLFCIDVLNLSL